MRIDDGKPFDKVHDYKKHIDTRAFAKGNTIIK
jgi:hypothetical protein